MKEKLVLYIYNLNYKVKVKWIKYELNKILSQYSKSYVIRINNKMPGQAFIEFKDKTHLTLCHKKINGMFLHDRELYTNII